MRPGTLGVRPRTLSARRLTALSLWATLSLCAGLLAGCSSSSAALGPWMRSVEQYLAQKSNDPDALREVTLEDGRHGFALLGGLDPRNSTDQRGLLVAHKVIGDRPWFIYLVGMVKNQQVQDIRAVALSAAGGQTIWRLGEKDPQALKLYRDSSISQWRQHAGERTAKPAAKPPADYTTFPREPDVFDVAVEGTNVHVKHAASGAQFSVDTAATTETKQR